VPLGYNDDLDNHLRNGTVKFPEQRYLIRTSQDNRWSEATWDDVAHAKYGVPYPGSGHMLLGIIRAEDPS
jgi:hypothetical protein